jgi:MFS family permease
MPTRLRITGMSSRTSSEPAAPSPVRLALFWLGIQAVWGALLGISLQARTVQLATGNAMIAYGHLATAGAMIAALVQIVAGPWSDTRRRNGSRRVEFYVAGALAAGIAIGAFYLASTMKALVIAFLCVQAAMNLASGPYQAIIPDFVSRDRFGVASSWMAALQSAGNAVGALCASLIDDARWLATALIGMLFATCSITSAHVSRLTLEAAPAPEKFAITRPFIDLFISRAFVYVGFYTLLGYLLFYVDGVLGATSLAQARRESGLLILAFTVVGVAGAAVAAAPSDRLDKRLVATIGGCIVSIALGIFIAAHGLAAAAAATAIAGFGWGIFLVADWAIACRILPAGALATTMGIWNLALLAPQIVAPALTTGFLQRFGLTAAGTGPRAAFGLALCETLLGIAWLWRLRRCVVGN